jgi:hypothetical protein
MEWVLNVNDREINVESVEKLKELLLNEQEKAKKQPVIAFVSCPDDSALSLGLGRDRSPLTYLPSDDSPSRHAVDDTKGDEEVIDFLLGGEYSEFPLMNTIKTKDAIEACIEFMNTGKISNKLSAL